MAIGQGGALEAILRPQPHSPPKLPLLSSWVPCLGAGEEDL